MRKKLTITILMLLILICCSGVANAATVTTDCPYHEGYTLTKIYTPADGGTRHSVTEYCNYNGYYSHYQGSEEHTWGSWTTKSEATCTDAKVEKRSCSRCGEGATRTVGEALGHDVVSVGYTAPTCTTKGSTTYECQRSGCGYGYTNEIDIDSEAHNWGGWVETTHGTCTTPGVETRTCSYNSAHTETRAGSTDSTNHNYGAWVETTHGTCTTPGVETRTCSYNSAHTETRTGSIDSTNHNYGAWNVTTPSTCTTEGVETRICANDASHVETRALAMSGHDWGAWTTTTVATCTQPEIQTRICKTNSAHTETQTLSVNADAHDWGAWVTTTEATCMQAEIQTKTCNYNSSHKETKTLSVDADAHDWGAWVTTTEATCMQAEIQTKTCNYNSSHKETKTLSVDADAHDWGAWVTTTQPTCTQPEIQTRICNYNSSHKETKTLNTIPDGHKDDDPYDGTCDYDPSHDLNTAPTVTLGSFNGEFFKSGDEITLTLTATKGTNAPETWDSLTFGATLAGVQGTVAATGAGAGTESTTATITWNADDITTDGSYKATVTVTDSKGKSAEATTTSSIIIDKSNPEKPTIDANIEWTNDDVEVTITAGNADVAGLDKVTYILSGATTKAETEITSGGKITIKNEGETTITAYTYDKAGNKSEAETKVVRIEKILPTVTFNPNGSNGEYGQSFITVVTVEDLGTFVSGVNATSLKYIWKTSTATLTEADFANATSFASGDQIETPADVSDNHYLWILAKDNAGNVAIVRSENFLVDQVKPTVEFDKNENTTYEKEHKVTVTVEDLEGVINSGVDASSLKYVWTTSNTAPAEADFANGTAFASGDEIATPEGVTGEYYLWVIAKDNVGNTIIAGSGVQKVDNEAPTLEYTLLAEGSSIYSAIEVIVTDMFDGEERSGVNESELKYEISLKPVAEGNRTYPESYTNNAENRFPENIEGQYFLYIRAEDNAGNVIEKTETIVIDTKLPVITFDPDGNTTFANTHSTVVTISDYSMITSAKYVWTTSDTEEPVDNKFADNFKSGDTVTTPEGLTGDYYLWVMVEDKAGNVVKEVSKVFKLDNRVPQVTFDPDGSIDFANSHETKVTVTEGNDESGVNLDSLKYVWTTSPTAPSKEEITESFTNGEEISTPEDVEGLYYLWIYAEDNTGNPVIIGSNVFNLDDKNVVVSFDPYENKAYAPEHSTKVTFSDLGSKVKEDSLKYFWTTDATIEDPEESLFTNSFVNGSLIETPEDGQGIYYLWVIGEDNVGNKITARSGEFWVDNTELPIEVTIIENVGITGKGVHITVDGTQKPFKEDSIKYLICYDAEKPLVSDFENSATNDSDVLFEEGIEKQAYVWAMAEDENGVVHMAYVYMIIDTKAPTVEFDPNGNAEDLSVVETVVTVTDYSVLDGTKYMWTTDATLEPTADQITNEFESGDTIAAPTEDGDYYLWVVATDLVGNTTLVRSEVFKVDHTAPSNPTVTGKEVIEGVPSTEELPTGSTTNKDVLVEVTPGVDERDEGVETTVTITKDGTPVEITPDENGNYPLTEDGEYVITVVTEDKAGNESDPVTYEVTIDKTAPAAPTITGKETAGETKDLPSGETTRQNVEITIEAEGEPTVTITKDGVPVEITPDADGKYLLTEEGVYVITATTKDEAGNESDEAIYEVTIDKKVVLEKPSLEANEKTPEQETVPDGGVTKEDVIISTEAPEEEQEVVVEVKKDGEDITDTLDKDEDGNYILDEEGEYEITVKTEDEDGNQSEEVTQTVTIDKTAPTPAIKGTDEETGNAIPNGGTTNDNVIIEIVPGVDNREDAEVTPEVTITKDGKDITDTLNKDENGNYILEEEGTYVVEVTSKDDLGNESDPVEYEVTIDAEAPDAPIISIIESIIIEGRPPVPGNPIPADGSTKEEVKVETDEDEPGEKTTITIIDQDGEDRTDDFTDPDTGDIIIDESGEYDIIATTTPEDKDEPKVESSVHVKVDLDAPVAEDDEKATEQNTPVDGKVEATDNFEVTEYEVATEPEHGTVTLDPATGEYTYTPEDGYYGEDSFEVVAKDEVGNVSEEATVTVTIRKELEESDIVSEKDKSISTYKNKPYTSNELPEVDKNGDALKYAITENPANGTVTFDETTRTFTYTPNEEYLGTDTFKMEVTNEKETVVITFNVEVKKKSSGGGTGGGSGSSDKEETVTHEWYIRGYEDGTVRPDGKVTREEIAMIFYRLYVGSNNTLNTKANIEYSDVDKNRWSYDAIMYLTEKGILKGYDDGSFKPLKEISRAELAAIIVRYSKLTSKTSVEFTDVTKEHWAKDSIEKVATKGWMIGYENGAFKPNAKLTRAEAAATINRLLGRNVEDVKVNDSPFSDLKASHWGYEDLVEAITTHTCVLAKDGKEEWKSHEYPYLEK